TADCHSAFDGKRLRALRHATCAWNQVMWVDGVTPGRLTAKMSSAQFWPLLSQGAKSSRATPSWVAPAACRSEADAFPLWIFFTTEAPEVVAFGTRQTLASYLSMQTVAETTESSGHFLSALAPCAPAVATQTASRATIVPVIRIVMGRKVASLGQSRQANRPNGVGHGHGVRRPDGRLPRVANPSTDAS